MEPKQVFREYTEISSGDQDGFNVCPVCGSGLIHDTVGGKSRKLCKACGFVHFKNPAPAVSILVVDNDRFLLCRRAKGTFKGGPWCLPCGYVEYDEDYLTAAIREVKEETGLDVEIKAVLSVVSNFFSPKVHTLVVVLLAHVSGGEIRPGDDADAVAWYSVSDILPELAFEADRHIIGRYFATKLAGAPVDGDYASPRGEEGF